MSAQAYRRNFVHRQRSPVTAATSQSSSDISIGIVLKRCLHDS